VEVDLPEDRLVPTVPQKLNYIHWIEDLLGLDVAGPGGGRVASCGGGGSARAVSTRVPPNSITSPSHNKAGDAGAAVNTTANDRVGKSFHTVANATDAAAPTTTTDLASPRRFIRGIDVGTGASCIHPLLATAMHPDWQFVATEVDDASTATAIANVGRNCR
jgi:hypothetical protein